MNLRLTRGRSLRVAACALVAATALGVAACGGDDDDETANPPATTAAVTTESTPTETAAAEAQVIDIPVPDTGLVFDVTEVKAKAGEITLRSVNPQTMPHNIAIDNPDPIEGEVVTNGGVSEITVTLEPGTYEYYCSVPGHREAGMVGTLIVE